MPAHVTDNDVNNAIDAIDVIEVIAPRLLGGIGCPPDFEARAVRRLGREELLLDDLRNAHLLPHPLLVQLSMRGGQLGLMLAALELAELFSLLFHLLGLAEQLDEHGHLRTAGPPG